MLVVLQKEAKSSFPFPLILIMKIPRIDGLACLSSLANFGDYSTQKGVEG